MSLKSKLAVFTGALVLGATPALAVAAMPADPGNPNKPDTPVGPSSTLPAKAKAYGKYCQNQSKKHVAGQKGTPFSQCVTAMAKAATGAADTPTQACKALSKKHVKGEKGTPYSRCVSGAAKLLGNQAS